MVKSQHIFPVVCKEKGHVPWLDREYINEHIKREGERNIFPIEIESKHCIFCNPDDRELQKVSAIPIAWLSSFEVEIPQDVIDVMVEESLEGNLAIRNPESWLADRINRAKEERKAKIKERLEKELEKLETLVSEEELESLRAETLESFE